MRWMLAVPLLLIGVWIIVSGWVLVFQWFIQKKHSSITPLVGGLLTTLGLLLMPSGYRTLWWMPLVVDVGCIPSLVLVLIHVLRRYLRRGR